MPQNLKISLNKLLCNKSIVEFADFEKQEVFAKAKLTKVKETDFKNLTKDDWDGHEKYSSPDAMYKTYSGYYKKPVGPKTKLKIIKFKLIT